MGHYDEQREAWEAKSQLKELKQAHMIGLVAPRPGSGKDTFLEVLTETLQAGDRLTNVKFAEALTKETHDQFHGTAYAEFLSIRDDQNLKDHPFGFFSINNLMAGPYKEFLKASEELDPKEKRSARWHLIEYGTSFKRQYLKQDDYWLTKGLQQARKVYGAGMVPVITDVRFPNEAARIKKAGGILVYIQPDWTPTESGGVADGLISPEDCHITVRNLKVNKTNMVKEFLNEYTI